MPIILESTHPLAKRNGTNRIVLGEDPAEPVIPCEYELVNEWFCEKRAARVYLCRHKETGKYDAAVVPEEGWPHRWKFLMSLFDVANYLDHEAEDRALQLLRSKVTDVQWNQYRLFDQFIEASPRSGTVYIFRKARPTLAMSRTPCGNYVPNVCLCLHPLAHYEGSWAGAMVPTDDVVTHLLLMRADEAYFWRKANHHEPHLASSGL